VDTTIDPIALDSYLALQYIPGPRTIYRGVHKLPPGHTLVAENGGVSIAPYWTLASTSPPRSFDEAKEEFRALFDDAVRLRLMSDVPLGAFLSGGIDSALVVGAMARAMDRPVRTFSIGFDEDSELPHAARVASHFGTQHETLNVSALDMQTLLPAVAVQMDEPLADPAAIPTYLLSRFAREHVTVALTGEGADELFAGYDRYRLEAMRAHFEWVPRPLRVAASRTIGPFAKRRVRKALEAAALDGAHSFVHLRSVMHPRVRRALLRPEVAAQVPADHLERRVARHFVARDGLNDVLRADTLEWLPDDLLMKVDKMSMLPSLEARVPFLDYRIVERVSSYPAAWKFRDGQSKVLLKAVAEDVLPSDIVHRRKHGFSPPIALWMRRDLRAVIVDRFAQDALTYEFLDSHVVARLISRFMTDPDVSPMPVWLLLNLEIWLQHQESAS
jgi:asparagine synthase (glutamine-hydrolysing)